MNYKLLNWSKSAQVIKTKIEPLKDLIRKTLLLADFFQGQLGKKGEKNA